MLADIKVRNLNILKLKLIKPSKIVINKVMVHVYQFKARTDNN